MENRELDALVAEKVFNRKPGVDFWDLPEHQWRRRDHGCGSGVTYGDECGGRVDECERCEDTCGVSCDHHEPDSARCVRLPVNCSENIVWAFLVVEEMRRRGWNIFTIVQQRNGEWWCSLRKVSDACERCKRDHTDAESDLTADTAPRAICLAALRALGVACA